MFIYNLYKFLCDFFRKLFTWSKFLYVCENVLVQSTIILRRYVNKLLLTGEPCAILKSVRVVTRLRSTFIEKAQIRSLYSIPAFHSTSYCVSTTRVDLARYLDVASSLFSLCIGDRIGWFRTCRMEYTSHDVARVSNSTRFRSRLSFVRHAKINPRAFDCAYGTCIAESLADGKCTLGFN